MDPQGRLRYAGIEAEGAFSVLRSASATSDPISARFLMRDNIPRFGDIEIGYGSNYTVFRNCRAVRQTISAGSNGRMKELTFEDRRWKWRYPKIYGRYNIYLKGQRVELASNQKSARDLAILCLQALGESGVDCSLLPNDVFPMTEFAGGSAASALEELCVQFGCVVTLGLDDAVRICKLGNGRSVPSNDPRLCDYSMAFEAPLIPETLRIESGRTLFQRDLPLQAVGYEALTREIKPIDELSYKPAAGWGHAKPSHFNEVKDPQNRGVAWDKKYRELAKSCIWKMYRVQGTPLGTVNMPIPIGSKLPRSEFELYLVDDATVVVPDAWRIIPLKSKQLRLWHAGVSANVNGLGNKDDLTHAEVLGLFHDLKSSQKNNTTRKDDIPYTEYDNYQGQLMRKTYPDEIYPGSFSIDEEKGIVHFADQVYWINRPDGVINADKYKPARIVLRTAFELRDSQTWDFLRQYYDYKSSGPNVAYGVTQTVRVEDLEYEVGWGPGGMGGAGTTQTDKAEFERRARFYAQKEIAKYALGDSATIPMRGLVLDIHPDGSITSVRLDRANDGRCMSTVEWQSENANERLTYDEKLKRMREADRFAEWKAMMTRVSKEQTKRGGSMGSGNW